MNAASALAASVLVLVLAGCAGPAPSADPRGTAAAASVAPEATVRSTVAPRPSPSPFDAVCEAGEGVTWVRVDAHANLFGAGLEQAPAPGGGGGGVLPPSLELPAGGTRLVTFPCTAGVTDCCGSPPSIGPGGYVGTQSTVVESVGGISGMVMEGRVMFLAGVFLTDAAPTEPAPERLDFSGRADVARLEPAIGQTFFIGDGVDRTIVAPAGATRLFLGFVDAYVFQGAPGWYGNNQGALEATVAIAVD